MGNELYNILVVDDDEGILDSMKDILETEGYNVETVNNGYDAIDIVKSRPFNLVTVDIKMPGMGGIGVLKALHEIDSTLPVIILTGFASFETASEAIRLGAYDYLTKPFEWDKLFNTIKRGIERKTLLSKNENLLEQVTKVNDDLKIKVEQLYKLNEIGKVMNAMLDIDNLLGYVLNTASQLLGAKKGTLLLFCDSNYKLHVKVTRGMKSNNLKEIIFKKGEGFIGKLVEKGEIYFASDDKSDKKFNGKDRLIKATAKDFVSFPLNTKGNVLGLLNLSDFDKNTDIKSNKHLGNILASQAATAIDNVRLYRNMQDSYLNVMNVLISTMEAKSKFTRGHSERVSDISRLFCEDLNLGEDQIEYIQQAGRLHDIGKLTISDFVLNKPEKLTQQEWTEIKLHPNRGANTLKPLGFLNGISPIIKSHHERFDGRGYPDGLSGKNIPQGARIISIIDAFDAMISPRPYRKPLEIEHVINEIKDNRNTQFDPEFADIFLNDTLPKIKKRWK